MSQVDIDTSIGYALKRVTASLRAAMDAELRRLDLTVSQYASLELLARRPGLSNAEWARGVFVSRQATHQLLSGMKQAGLVEVEGVGRDQRISLTPAGTRRLVEASGAVAEIQEKMLSGLDERQRDSLRRSLEACVDGLEG